MTNKLKVAVIGLGILGSRHARVWSELADAELVAVMDVNGARTKSIGEKHNVPSFDNLDRMLAETQLDAVSIATPDHLHLSPTVTALKAGKHVLLEKPLATNADDARTIVAAASAANKIVAVNFSQRCVSDHIWLKEQIHAGNIGTPRMVISVKFDTIFVPTGMIPGWSTQTSPLYFMSSHDLDLTHWFLGADPVQVVAQEVRGTLDARGFAVHDGLNALIQFANGASANFHSSWIHPNTYPRIADGYIQIIGSEGALMYNNRTRTAEIYNAQGGQKIEFTGAHTADEVNGKITGAFVASLENFVDCIRTHREPDTSPRRALPIALAQAAAIESLTSSSFVRVHV